MSNKPTQDQLLADGRAEAKYWMEYHHKTVGWYVTVMGFFIAGTIASPTTSDGEILWAIIIISTLVLTYMFYHQISTYSGRIAQVEEDMRLNEIPSDWHDRAKAAAPSIKGAGSIFFTWVLVTLQIVVIVLATNTFL